MPGLVYQLLDYLNRPSSATLGATAELVKGMQGSPSDPIAGLLRGLTTGETGGQDVVAAALNRSTESLNAGQRGIGLGLDLVNPMDPLNFVGFGGLTKVGKVAKLLQKVPGAADALRLAPKLSDQIALGQRGLITFGGHSLPVGAGAVRMAENLAGKAKVAPYIGQMIRGAQQALGGKRGAVVGSFDTPEMQRIANIAYDMSNDIGVVVRGFEESIRDDFSKLDRLTPDEGTQLGDIISKINRGDLSLQDGMMEFMGTGTEKRMKLREDAWKSAQGVYPKLKQFSGILDGTGLDRYLGSEMGFLPRVYKPKGGSIDTGAVFGIDRLFGHDSLGNVTVLKGQAANPLNKALNQRSIQGVSPETLDDAGKKEILNWTYIDDKGVDVNGIDAFNAEMVNKPASLKRFLEKHRLDLPALDAKVQDTGYATVERNAVRLLKELQRQTTENVRTDLLVQDLKANGIAKAYDPEMHADPKKWVRVDQGRFSGEPLAVPAEWSEAIGKVLNIMAPHPNTSIFGMQLRDILPKPIADFGLMSALKLSLIYGMIPTPGLRIKDKHIRGIPMSAMSYWSRNFGTGVFNNAIEGLSPIAVKPGSMSKTIRHYSTGFELAKDWSRGEVGNGTIRIGDVTIDKKRLWQMYKGMNMHGGGVPELDITSDITNETKAAQWLTRKRQELFNNTTDFEHKGWRMNLQTGQDASEYMVRIPLMLHILEDTFEAASKNGIELPSHIRALGVDGETGLIRNHKRSMSAYKYGKETGMENINLAPGDVPPVIEDHGGIIWAAFENAREGVIRAHFDYTDLSPIEQRIRASWIPFYTWMRKNIPRQTIKMTTDFGRYMPFARAYYRAFENQGMDPDDLPPWMAETYAIPIQKPDGRVRVLDMTGVAPFVDAFELGAAAVGRPRYGGSRVNDMMRWMGQNANPLLMLPVELMTQTDTLGRRFEGDQPVEYMGLPISQNLKQGMDLFRGLGDVDRLNPGGIFTKLGELTGTIKRDDRGRRPNRNESPEAARWLRQSTSITVRDTDPNKADLSIRARKQQLTRLKNEAKKQRQEGLYAEARKTEKELERLRKSGGR